MYQVIYDYEHIDGTIERNLTETFDNYKKAIQCYNDYKEFEWYFNLQLNGGI